MWVISKQKNLQIPPFLLVEQLKQQKQKKTSHPLAQIVGHFINTHFFNIPFFLAPIHVIERKNLFPYTTQIVYNSPIHFCFIHSTFLWPPHPLTFKTKGIFFSPHTPPKQLYNSLIQFCFIHSTFLWPPRLQDERKTNLFPYTHPNSWTIHQYIPPWPPLTLKKKGKKLFPIYPPKQLDNSLIHFFLIHSVFLHPLTFKKKEFFFPIHLRMIYMPSFKAYKYLTLGSWWTVVN